MITIISIGLCILFSYLFYRNFLCRPKLPKGFKETPLEKGFPFLGIIPQVKTPLYVHLEKLTKKHGSIFRIRIGMRDVVVLNNYDFIKKALKENGDVLSGRLILKSTAAVTRNSGILFIDGEKWAKQRSFVLTVLRDFGLGRTKSQEIVQSECSYLLDELRDTGGKVVDFDHLIPLYTANIISKFIMDKRYFKDDPVFKYLEKTMSDFVRKINFINFIQLMFPILAHFDPFIWLVKLTSQYADREKIHHIIQEVIDEHKQRLDLNSEGEDLIDRFLIKQHQMKAKSGTVDTFTEWQLIRNAIELFIAGFETTSTTLGWALFFMAKHPDIQEKAYLEIVNTIGNEKMPTMNDKKALHYTMAVMDEIMRLGTVVPLSVSHRTLSDVTLDEYFVPKDTLIFPNIFACHMDPNKWDKPTEFNPERFLSLDENGDLKYCPREDLIPFSMGKRQCLGESLARMEYFIFFTSILQNFRVRLSATLSDKQNTDTFLANDGVIRFCAVKDFIFTSRNQD